MLCIWPFPLSHAGSTRPGLADVTRSENRIQTLDGLRGLAILLVMVLHFTMTGGMVPTTTVDRLFTKIAMLGWCGVDLFFVLSGFLITGILYDARGTPTYFRSFYARRVLRIFPLYYGFLAVRFLVLVGFHTWPAELRSELWSWTYMTNVLQTIRGSLAAAPIYTGHFWSLAVEEQFYLFWPLVIWYLPRRGLGLTCGACLVIAPLVRWALALSGNPIATYVLMPARLDALCVGALLSVLACGREGLERLANGARTVAVGSLIIFLFVSWVTVPPIFEALFVPVLDHTAAALFFGALLVIAVTSSPSQLAGRALGNRMLVLIGQRSYALYVFHVPLEDLVRQYGFGVDSLGSLIHSQLAAQFIFFAVAGGVTFAVATLSWHSYEKQFLKLKRRFPYQLAKSRRS